MEKEKWAQVVKFNIPIYFIFSPKDITLLLDILMKKNVQCFRIP